MSTHSGISSRLFLSADLVGSTARKVHGSKTWMGDVLAFYQQFPYHLDQKLQEKSAAKTTKVQGFGLLEEPKLWKPVGDELIYTAPVDHEDQICVIVDAWISAMRETERIVLDKAKMDLKGAAWLATFPLPDRAVGVPMDPTIYDPDMEPEVVNRTLLDLVDNGAATETVRTDYLGPSIDIGFRVASHATARRFTVSLETAWAIATSRQTSGDATPMYFAGETSLKGVWGGRGYPLFWLDTGNRHAAQETLDSISGLTAVSNERVRDLGDQLKEIGDWPCKLYLPASAHTEFHQDLDALNAESERLEAVLDTSAQVPDLPSEDPAEPPTPPPADPLTRPAI